MVIRGSHSNARRQGALMIDLLAALALLLGALLPLAYHLAAEKRLARTIYQRALAVEIVDGELEVLAAGEWRAYAPGTHRYLVRAASATNLPPGEFQLVVVSNRVRLAWQPAVKGHGGPVVREVGVR
jgi:hypothetical protein